MTVLRYEQPAVTIAFIAVSIRTSIEVLDGCRLEDLPAAVEVADGMLEHLNQLQASTSPLACFQVMGLSEAVLANVEPSAAAALSDEVCVAYIRKAIVL